MRLLVTGGAGFIGSAFVRRRLAATGDSITVIDKLTYAGSRNNLADVEHDRALSARFRFVHGDICDAGLVNTLVREADAVVNFAAESHVDRSILDAGASLRTGVIGVHVLLESLRTADRAVRFVQVSTDEVYGEVREGVSLEGDALRPRSPYAAAKAAGELLVQAYHATHGTDAVVTRGANTYGPRQHPEKLVPLFVTNALENEPLPLYGDGRQERDWLFVDDHADAVGLCLDRGMSGETYNVPGTGVRRNRDVTESILRLVGRDWDLVRSVPDRPGHDRRYAMDGAKMAALGWQPAVRFDAGMALTVDWYRDNPDWWHRARSGDWATYYDEQYGWRLAQSVDS